MKILYIGDEGMFTTSAQRADALRRLGHEVFMLDPYKSIGYLTKGLILGRLHYYTGYRLLQQVLIKRLKEILFLYDTLDLIWVNGGELLGPLCLQTIKAKGCPVILYNNDDPAGGRDGRRFDSMLRAIPYYDVCVVMREVNVIEYKKRGAKFVFRVYMGYDEIAHQPFANSELIDKEFRSEVAFIGTWMRHENRDKFLLELIKLGVPISIWGGRWKKSPYWNALRPAYRGGSIVGRDYVSAIQGSKICIGLLSKGNRDLHTQRSLEVPFAGGLLCAERTTEHTEMYKEGTEAVFWNDATECAKICLEILDNESRREEIVAAGKRRVRQLGVGNENMCKKVLEVIFNSI